MSVALPAVDSSALVGGSSPTGRSGVNASSGDGSFGAVWADTVEAAQDAPASDTATPGNGSPETAPQGAEEAVDQPAEAAAETADSAEPATSDDAGAATTATTTQPTAQPTSVTRQAQTSATSVVDPTLGIAPADPGSQPVDTTAITAASESVDVAPVTAGLSAALVAGATTESHAEATAALPATPRGEERTRAPSRTELALPTAPPIEQTAEAGGEASALLSVDAAADAAATTTAKAALGGEDEPASTTSATMRGPQATSSPTAQPTNEPRADAVRAPGSALIDLLGNTTGPDTADRFAAQVGWMTRNGSQFARLQVHPEELGPIDIAIEQRDGSLAVTLSASHAATRSLLEQHVERMRELLQQGGAPTTRLDVTADGAGRDRERDAPQRPEGGAAPRANEDELPPIAGPVALLRGAAALLDAYA